MRGRGCKVLEDRKREKKGKKAALSQSATSELAGREVERVPPEESARSLRTSGGAMLIPT